MLNGINFEAKPGQVVALLGATGSGKSTVINLIPRFYDPTAGQILIDGQDIREVTVNSLREQIGIVMQDTTLFAATVRENIAFGRPGRERGRDHGRRPSRLGARLYHGDCPKAMRR